MQVKNTFSIFISLFICCSLYAQEGKLIPPKKLLKDFDALTEMIEAHPAPYRHKSEKEFKALIDSTRKLLNQPMDAVGFYKLASPIYAAIKDGHTSMSMPSYILKKHWKENGVFPYKIYITEEDRMYIIENHGQDSSIALGAEILKLNDIPVADFIKNISRYISYEQEIFRNTIIEKGFDFYLLLYFGKTKEIKLDYLSDALHSHVVKYIQPGEWKKKMAEEEEHRRKKIAAGEPYEYTKIKDGVGFLKIYSFAIYQQDKYDFFLRKMLRKIKKDSVQSLIIDVRGNTGGFPKVVSDLLHCISEKYFKTMARSEMKVSDAYKNYFNEMAPSVDLSRRQFFRPLHSIDLNSLFAKKTGTFVVEDKIFNEPPQQKNNEYSGDLYLLIDRRSFSASSSFAATFRCYQLGVIIGSETGGTKVFHANSMWKKMKHTGISCGMATTRLYTACFHEEDEGIQPDLTAKPSIQDLVAKRDAALSYTLRVIKKVQKMRKEEMGN